jgi:Protein of unknown function (DUF3667)
MNAAAPPAASSPAAPGPGGSAPPATAAVPAQAPAAAAVAPAPPPPVRCDNCGAPVPRRYCGNCGQRLEPPVHSLWHFAKLATEDLTHADSRVWRTLAALLFRPGRLTAEFLAGRRARYLPPVRLYLVLSVVFFLWAANTQEGSRVLQLDDEHAPAASAASVRGAGSSPAPALAAHGQAPAGRAGAPATPQQRDLRCHMDYEGPWAATLGALAARSCQRIVADNGRSLQEAFLHNLPRAMFVFLPLLAAGMMLMYWWPRHYYVEHLLLLLHDHCFVFLGLMLAWVAVTLLPVASGWVHFAMTLYILWYMFRSMRVVYGQSRALTAIKLVALSFFYLASGAVMIALTTVYSALML